MGKMRHTHKIFVKKTCRKRPFGRRRFRWEGNIKIDLKEIECGNVDWIYVA
jgi:hypothetical protein